jgi:hypothetical protein
MVDVKAVERAAQNLGQEKNEAALELLIGLQQEAIDKNPKLADDPNLAPQYAPHMGLLDDIKSLGARIGLRWAKELHSLVCEKGDQGERDKLMNALNLGETATIGAVAAALMALGVPAPIAAAGAALIVKRFIWPARDELCVVWGEKLEQYA